MKTWFYFLLLMGCACNGPDEELAWNVGESRQYLPSLPREGLTTPSDGEFEAFTPLGLQRFRLALVARESLAIESKARVLSPEVQEPTQPFGLIASLGMTSVSAGADVGSIYGLGNKPVVVGEGATVHGYVKAHAGLAAAIDAKVTIGIMDQAPSGIERFHWQVAFPAFSTADTKAPIEGPLALAPGAYASLPGRDRIRLAAGQYYFRSVVVKPTQTLEIDNTGGPVILWIRDEFKLSGELVKYSTEPSLLIGYAGTKAPEIHTALVGTLVAPAASIELPKTRKPHNGSVFAMSIRLMPGAVLEQSGYWPNLVAMRSPKSVCDDCSHSMRRELARCCDQKSRARIELADLKRRCLDSCVTGSDTSDANCVPGCFWEPETVENDLQVDGCLREAVLSYDACLLRERLQTDSCVRMGLTNAPAAACGRK